MYTYTHTLYLRFKDLYRQIFKISFLRNDKEKGDTDSRMCEKPNYLSSSVLHDSLWPVRCHIARPNSSRNVFWKTKYIWIFSRHIFKKFYLSILPGSTFIHPEATALEAKGTEEAPGQKSLPAPDIPIFKSCFSRLFFTFYGSTRSCPPPYNELNPWK